MRVQCLSWGGAALASAGMAASPVAENTPLGSGPLRAVLEVIPGLPTHTLYHPADLAASGPLPVVLWGNGACANAGDRFRWFLSDIASYGYLIIAVGPIQNKSVWPAQVMTPFAAGGTPVIPPGVTVAASTPATHSAQLLDGLHWAVAENERTGSRFYHRLRVDAVAAMGQSCGGPRHGGVRGSTYPHHDMWNSGRFPGVTTMAGGAPLTKDSLREAALADRLHQRRCRGSRVRQYQ